MVTLKKREKSTRTNKNTFLKYDTKVTVTFKRLIQMLIWWAQSNTASEYSQTSYIPVSQRDAWAAIPCMASLSVI